MPLFKCEKCGCVENTATSDYWWDKSKGNPLICSECQTGIWHGRFEKKSAEGCFIDSEGFIYAPEEVEDDGKFIYLKYNPSIQMIGKV